MSKMKNLFPDSHECDVCRVNITEYGFRHDTCPEHSDLWKAIGEKMNSTKFKNDIYAIQELKKELLHLKDSFANFKSWTALENTTQNYTFELKKMEQQIQDLEFDLDTAIKNLVKDHTCPEE